MNTKKHIFSFAISFVVAFGALAQSFTLDNVTYTVTAPASQELLEAHVELINNSSSNKNVHVARTPITLVAGSENNFCWGTNCYPPNVSVSTNPEEINATGLNESFKGDYYPNGNIGTSTIKYCFYDASNISDSVCVNIRYSALDPNSVKKNNKSEEKGFLNNAYPNPANTFATVEYTLPRTAKSARLVISNMIGSTVKEFNINNSKGVIVIPVSQLDNGFYFYSLQADGNTIATKRLVVNH